MTTTTKKMLQREARQTADKANTALLSVNTAIKSGEGREAYNALIESMAQSAKLEALQAYINDTSADNSIMILSTIFTITALKTASRGHAVKDKNGVAKLDDSGNVKMTPINLTALRILQYGIHDDSGILDDLRQETAIKIWEAIADGRATIGNTATANGDIIPTFELTNADSDNTTMKDIFNVVQAYLYTTQQRHYKREYRPIIDDNGNEDIVMVTAAMREYEKSVDYIDIDDLLKELAVVLNERDMIVLRSKCNKKQVERSYSDNGKSKKRYVSRYKTIAEISAETGYTVKEVRNSTKNIADKLRSIYEL